MEPSPLKLKKILKDAVDRHFIGLKKDPQNYESINKVITRFFDQFDLHFHITDQDNSMTIVECVWEEVVEFYGGECWTQAELYFSRLDQGEKEKLYFSNYIEILYGFCMDYS
jgi:hypothetical protein